MTRHEQYAAHAGMTTFTLRHSETGQTVEYTAMDLRCAQMLAAADHSEDDEDCESWEVFGHFGEQKVTLI